MSKIYQQHILEHFQNPEHYGELPNPDLVVTEHNPLCGDKITIYLKFNQDKTEIQEISFTGEGCAISQASTSILLDELHPLSTANLTQFSKDDLLQLLKIDLSPARLKCALLGLNTIKQALSNYRRG